MWGNVGKSLGVGFFSVLFSGLVCVCLFLRLLFLLGFLESEQQHILVLCSSRFVPDRGCVIGQSLLTKKLTLSLLSLSSYFLVISDSCVEVVA